jgi:chromate transporter
MQEISIFRLLLIFLKIGTTAFGGNIALVAAVRKDLCQKRKLLSDEQVLDFTSLGNVLPGPLATNVIAACGFAIRGMWGAIAGLIGIILPALLLICILTEAYFRYGESPVLMKIFGGLLPGVAAVIAATAWSLAKKNISNVLHVIILIGAGAAIFFLKGFLVTLIIIIVSGLIGFFFFNKKTENNIPSAQGTRKKSHLPVISIILMLLIGLVVFILHPANKMLSDLRMLGLTFGSMSVTLFGGGYVFIPAIEKVVVGMHHWVSSKEFADGIAMGQVTPGPVAITASFVGYRVAGIWGAVVSAITIFVPPALLMVLSQQFIDRIKGKPAVEAVFKGVRPAVIGMIVVSVWVIGKSAPQDWQSIVIFLSIFIISVWKNFDTAILIPVAGLMGYLLHLI